MSDALGFDPGAETDRITGFIRARLQEAGRSTLVLGLSGGLDSSVAALLCARAVESARVHAFVLPHRKSPPESPEHARLVVHKAGIPCEDIDITPAVDALSAALAPADRRRLGNIMARVRMIILYDRSAALDGLVVGTGNRTEWLLGYATLHGDSACAFRPIGHLYKSQVRQLARHLGVPGPIIAKPPSAGLWPGQTDEGELGLSYDDADRALVGLIDLGRTVDEVVSDGVPRDVADRVQRLVRGSAFKRRLPGAPEPLTGRSEE
ncbi:MAG: NAD+ synthase [Planctomycetota bacterium]